MPPTELLHSDSPRIFNNPIPLTAGRTEQRTFIVLRSLYMKNFQYTIQDPMGLRVLRARLCASKGIYQQNYDLLRGKEKSRAADAAMAVMGLGIKQGQTVTVTIDGPDEDKAFAELQVQFRENA